MITIFITEKPSVAQEYRKVLQVKSTDKKDGYIEGFSPVLKKDVVITWAVGHLIGICSPEGQNADWGGRWEASKLPMIPDQFKYEVQKATAAQFKVVKALYTRKDVEAIYYAGDSGREGMYIQALIRNQIFKAAPKIDERVVWIDSYTEDEILKGIRTAKPYTSYQPMIDSGYARAIADWLIGMNFTMAFSITSGETVNTGRVMTPTLAMIVQRQREIDNFTKTYYYGVEANKGLFWKAVKGSRFFESDDLYNEHGFSKKEHAEELIAEFSKSMQLTVDDVKVQQKTEYAPYLFNLADLQAFCSKRFKVSPAQALSVAQSLYEKKFTTYPRTDCRFLSSAVAADLKKQGYDVPKRYVDDSKVTDHYAIIPTFQGNPSTLTGLEADVYAAILKRFEDTMKPPYIYDSVSVTYLHPNGERFFESFKNVKQLGFKAGAAAEEEEETDTSGTGGSGGISTKTPPKKGDTVQVTAYTLRNMETKPPVAYTTGSLILAMEKAGKLIEDEELREQIKTCGIGTSATRAAIIEKLRVKEFITIDKKQKVAPTPLGNAIIPLIEKYDEALISPVKTADMESHLHAIADGELSLADYRGIINRYVSETTTRILSGNRERLPAAVSGSKKSVAKPGDATHECPCCGKTMKFGRFGWYCECKFSVNLEICGHKMKDSDVEDIAVKGHTKVYTFKSKAGKAFKAKLVLDKDAKKLNFEFANN